MTKWLRKRKTGNAEGRLMPAAFFKLAPREGLEPPT